MPIMPARCATCTPGLAVATKGEQTMFRFVVGLAIGLVGGYLGADYWLKWREEQRRRQEELIEIDQIPLPSS